MCSTRNSALGGRRDDEDDGDDDDDEDDGDEEDDECERNLLHQFYQVCLICDAFNSV